MSNYNTTLQSNNADLQEVLQALQSKAAGGQATPVISVSSNGLITATAGTKSSTHQLAFQAAKTITPSTASQIAVSSGYYTGGNITVASVPTQTKTVTPTSTTQNVTPDSGKFLSKVTVNGDSDLVAGNIKSGVNIFGVTGTYVGNGGGNTSVEDGIVTRSLTSYTNDRVTSIGSYAFTYCINLTTISFPMVTSVGEGAFSHCTNLTTISFPMLTSIGEGAFSHCTNLTTISFPMVTTIGANAFTTCNSLNIANFPLVTDIRSNAFRGCSSLTTISLPTVINISSWAFYRCRKLAILSLPTIARISNNVFTNCYNLKSLYLMGSSVCNLFASTVFNSTPIGGYSTSAGTYGSIYVPTSLLTSYKTATNWTYFSSRFVGI